MTSSGFAMPPAQNAFQIDHQPSDGLGRLQVREQGLADRERLGRLRGGDAAALGGLQRQRAQIPAQAV